MMDMEKLRSHLNALCRLLVNDGYMTDGQCRALLDLANEAKAVPEATLVIRKHLDTGRGSSCIPPAKRMIHLALDQHAQD